MSTDTIAPGPTHSGNGGPDRPARRVGVEIEFAGIPESRTAGLLVDLLGGQVLAEGPLRHRIECSALGTIRVELDTAWHLEIAQGPEFLGTLAHQVIPVEVITGPLQEAELVRLDEVVETLRAAGAQGTRAALTNGFGVHFNAEVPAPSMATVLPAIQAYALLEPWLRAHEPMGLARRALPFTAPWPNDLRRALLLLDRDRDDLGVLIDIYLTHAPSRNFGLDLLPLLRQIDEDRVLARLGDDAPGARPTFHFRLPSCRIDEPGWTVTGEWQKWLTVEALAAYDALRGQLGRLWLDEYASRLVADSAWVDRLDRILAETRAAGDQGA